MHMSQSRLGQGHVRPVEGKQLASRTRAAHVHTSRASVHPVAALPLTTKRLVDKSCASRLLLSRADAVVFLCDFSLCVSLSLASRSLLSYCSPLSAAVDVRAYCTNDRILRGAISTTGQSEADVPHRSSVLGFSLHFLFVSSSPVSLAASLLRAKAWPTRHTCMLHGVFP